MILIAVITAFVSEAPGAAPPTHEGHVKSVAWNDQNPGDVLLLPAGYKIVFTERSLEGDMKAGLS